MNKITWWCCETFLPSVITNWKQKRLTENGKLPQNNKKTRGEITVYIFSVGSKNVIIISCKSIKIQKKEWFGEKYSQWPPASIAACHVSWKKTRLSIEENDKFLNWFQIVGCTAWAAPYILVTLKVLGTFSIGRNDNVLILLRVIWCGKNTPEEMLAVIRDEFHIWTRCLCSRWIQYHTPVFTRTFRHVAVEPAIKQDIGWKWANLMREV